MDNSLVSAAEAAKILGISSTSLKNWERHGYITSYKKSYFSKEIFRLQEDIKSGKINRLGSRANKKQAHGTMLPSAAHAAYCREISAFALPRTETMFLLCARLFIIHEEISCCTITELTQFDCGMFKRECVRELLREFYDRLTISNIEAFNFAADNILRMELPQTDPADTDIAGIVYQAVSRRGDRAVSGSFYTPAKIAADMTESALEELHRNEDAVFIDPCCGTGRFLLAFIKSGGKAENTYGIDSDETASFTAASNILLQCRDLRSIPGVFTANSLLDGINSTQTNLPSSFDLIATNPPWGAYNNGEKKELTHNFPDIKSGESFSYFINLTLDLVRPGGIVSVVLPESITSVSRHRDIRKMIIKRSRILKITNHGRIFRGVFTPVLTIELIKKNNKICQENAVKIKKKNDEYAINIDKMVADKDYCFNININNTDIGIIDKVYATPHSTLKNKADWALGIVTGENSRFLSSSRGPGYEPIIRGSDISPALIRRPEYFIKFNIKDFQQTAPEWKYRASEKLVYRFISKHLIFALDTEGRLTLNSANVLIPRIETITARQLMRLFNSDIYNFIYQKRFNSIKVLRSHLEQLPVPATQDINSFDLSVNELNYIKNSIR